jgi:hypothetical protein
MEVDSTASILDRSMFDAPLFSVLFSYALLVQSSQCAHVSFPSRTYPRGFSHCFRINARSEQARGPYL